MLDPTDGARPDQPKISIDNLSESSPRVEDFAHQIRASRIQHILGEGVHRAVSTDIGAVYLNKGTASVNVGNYCFAYCSALDMISC